MEAAKVFEGFDYLAKAGFFALLVGTVALAAWWLTSPTAGKQDPNDPHYDLMSGKICFELDEMLAKLRKMP